jgi:hypothetical protein
MMAHPFSTQQFADLGGPNLVYVREIRAGEALADSPVTLAENHLAPDQLLYAIHGADGRRLALLSGREEAFAAAMANELAPVSVH